MVSEETTVGVFGGPERIISTNLTMQACLHRLQGDDDASWSAFGWKPFKHAPAIHRKLRGNKLKVLNSSGARRDAWWFYANIQEHNGLATIKGRYRAATFLWILLGIFALYGMYLYIGSLLSYEVFLIGRRNGGWRTMSPTAGLFIGFFGPSVLLVVYTLQGFLLRHKHAQQEQEIINTLQRL